MRRDRSASEPPFRSATQASATGDGSVAAQAPCGRILGQRRAGLVEFLGIPYARAPVGSLRFARPEPRPPFTRPFLADRYGPAAPQRRAIPEQLGKIFGLPTAIGEDCLNLNVWTPSVTGSRPVLVFIHGGAFVIGSGAQYPGGDLARRGDCVTVTFNYRLGSIGFNAFSELYPGDPRFVANAGFHDQRLALAWVRDNIAAFGGDPDRITLAGESAGAGSVAFHLVAEHSKPLFRQAIIQSGGLNLLYPRPHATEVAERVLKALGCRGDRNRLFDLPADAFSAELKDADAGQQLGVVARPHVDGFEVPDRPLRALYGAMKPCPLIVGTNRDEFSFFSELPLFPIDSSREAMRDYLVFAADARRADIVSALYRDDKPGRIAFGTDLLFRMPAIHLADTHSGRAPTFMYRLDWEAKGLLGRLGATHSVDLPLLFEDFLKPFRSTYLGLLPDHRRQELSQRMRAHWLAFVHQGRPGVDWPAYRTVGRETMIFGREDRCAADPEHVRRLAWEGIDAFTL